MSRPLLLPEDREGHDVECDCAECGGPVRDEMDDYWADYFAAEEEGE